jgi:hypothetical protein
MKAILTKLQAFNAMMKFLTICFYEIKQDNTLGDLLAAMQFLKDGSTADPAYWSDWEKITSVRKELNALETYNAMIEFLKINLVMASEANTLPLDKLSEIDQELQLARQFFLDIQPKQGKIKQPLWDKWIKCVEKALNEPEGTRQYLELIK